MDFKKIFAGMKPCGYGAVSAFYFFVKNYI